MIYVWSKSWLSANYERYYVIRRERIRSPAISLLVPFFRSALTKGHLPETVPCKEFLDEWTRRDVLFTRTSPLYVHTNEPGTQETGKIYGATAECHFYFIFISPSHALFK